MIVDAMSTSDIWTLVSFLLGTLISIGVAHYYFWKSKPVEKRLQSIVENLRNILVRARFPEFFESPNALEIQIPALDSDREDVPQLDQVIFDRAIIYPGNTVDVLFKVVDLGFNFSNPRGAEVNDGQGKLLRLENVGFGHIRTSFIVPETVAPGSYKLTFVLTDEDELGQPNNVKKYEVPFRVNALK